MPAPDLIVQLVNKFKDGFHQFGSQSYNEENLKIEFLNPFFESLGWDISNEAGIANQYKDVEFEYALKIGKTTKAPDYAFRVGGTIKFFVEAKKPFENIKSDQRYAYQLRRYAWNAKLPLSILTDFEEYAVYNTRIKPDISDKANIGRILYYKYTDYIDKWDEIKSIFSKNAVWTGNFDKYAGNDKLKKGTTEVDDAFLKEIEDWRELLAKNIALRNSSLSNRTLNEAIQRTIDRIIFLRICEDRAIEPERQLQILLNGNNVYLRLKQIYLDADSKFNSGLFHFHTESGRENYDKVSLELNIDDKPLKEIIKRLYYPESPYEFSIIPIEILGQVYERFLGKVICLTTGHQAKIEEKPEVRKAGGVYYTPQYIVNYIVENTVAKILQDKTIEEAKQIKILDPACGSGSFLLGAYKYLLDWYLKKYSENAVRYLKGKEPKIYVSGPLSYGIGIREAGSRKNKSEGMNNNYSSVTGSGLLTTGYNLTTKEKKEILLANIYGVDIDAQAVEVTKLSLLLKVLEGETEESLKNRYRLFKERALPDLANNIKCGNSLIGSDFYDDKPSSLFTEDDYYKINAFDWEKEFPKVLRLREEMFDKEYFKNHLKKGVEKAKEAVEIAGQAFEHTSSAFEYAKKFDLVKEPCMTYKSCGGFDVIIGNPPYVNIANIQNQQRKYFKIHYKIRLDLFTLFIEKSFNLLSNKGVFGFIIPSLFLKGVKFKTLRQFFNNNVNDFNFKEFGDNVFKNVKMPACVITVNQNKGKEKTDFFTRSESGYFNKKPVENLVNICSITRGLEIGRSKLHDSGEICCVTGSDIDRYIIKSYHFINKSTLIEYKKNNDIFDGDKLLIRETGNRLFSCFDNNNILSTRSIYNIKSTMEYNLKYILGIINSKLFLFYFNCCIAPNTNIFPKIRIVQAKQIPIRKINSELLT